MSDTYLVVGIHGAPTPETAPHGYFFVPDNDWNEEVQFDLTGTLKNGLTVWWPAPAPPTEQAPPPEPVKRWVATWDHDGWLLRHATPDDAYSSEDATSAADALNALDRDGVAWGPGRPMSELPDDGLVLVQMSSGVPYTFYIRKADYIATHRNTYECWWPLPLPGEAQ